jgi:hypothetical protein
MISDRVPDSLLDRGHFDLVQNGLEKPFHNELFGCGAIQPAALEIED